MTRVTNYITVALLLMILGVSGCQAWNAVKDLITGPAAPPVPVTPVPAPVPVAPAP